MREKKPKEKKIYQGKTKKEITQFKSFYKSGKLKFKARNIAEILLKDFKKGLIK